MEESEGQPPQPPEQPTASYARPQFEVAPPPVIDWAAPPSAGLGRAPTSWVLLAMMFVILIFLTLASIRTPSIGPGADPYFAQSIEIKSVMKAKRLATVLTGGMADGDRAVPTDTITQLRSKADSDPRAARLLVEGEFESGQSIPPLDLKRISSTLQSRDNDFVAIYSSKKLTEDQARNLTANFPKNDSSYDYARVHAFDKAGDPAPRNEMSPAWKMRGVAVLEGGAFLGVAIGLALWVLFFALRADGRLPKPQHPAEPLSLAEADRFAYRGVLFLGLFLMVSILSSLFTGASEAAKMFGEFTAIAIGVVLLHKVPVIGLRLPLSRIGVSTKGLFKNIGFGLVGYLMALPGIAIALAIYVPLSKIFGASSHPATELVASNPNTVTVLALYFAAAMIAPFWEEIMFRGTLLPGLTRVLGKPVWGILVSSFLFASIHPQGIPLWLGLGFIGAMNGMLAYQTRSLVPSITLHAVHNALIITLGLLLS